MAQQVKELAAQPEDLSSIPEIYIKMEGQNQLQKKNCSLTSTPMQ